MTIVRPFNTYGPRQSARAIIPTIITQIANGEREIKVGDLTPTRDFNYVADTAAGFIAIAKCPEAVGKEINIATGTEISMQDTLAAIARIMGADITWERDPARIRPAASEVFRLCGDASLLRSLTGWQPRHTLEEGLRKTVDWFTSGSHMEGYKPGIYNR